MYPTFKFGKEITVLETFAGIGSQRKALDRLAKKYDLKINYLPPIEFDKYAIEVITQFMELITELKTLLKQREV